MNVLLAFVVVSIYVLILVALAIYGLNFFYLTMVAPRVRGRLVEQPLPDRLPRITVQLPIYNEQLVAQRVIDAAAQLDWPHDRLEIQVLDDSTDATRDIAAQAVLRWQRAGMNIRHIHRVHRQGYKAGALAAGLRDVAGEFIAIFDADFVPAPDFLRRTIGAFSDPRVGFVQTRWEHLNRTMSVLTYLQALSIDGHFMIEQMARTGRNYVMNFNGTAGIWRRAAIEDAGGWNPGSLTEDLDLSYRAALRGWKPAYLPDVSVPSELVASMLAYRKQQTRWAQGSIETARHLMPVVLRSKLSPAAKIEAMLHLTGYGIQLLMLAVSLLYPFLMTAQMPGTWHTLLLALGALLGPTVLAPPFLFLTAQRLLRPARWWRKIPGVLALSVLGTGMVLNNTRALWRGLRSRRAVFERTPKSGLIGKDSGPLKPVYRPHGDRLVIVEFCLAAWNLYTAHLAWSFHNPGIFVNALLFAAGLSFVAGLTAWEMQAARWISIRSILQRARLSMLRKDRTILALAPTKRDQRSEDFSQGDVV